MFFLWYLDLFFDFMNNFIKWYRIIRHFEKRVLNYQTSQTSVFKFLNVSFKGTPLEFAVKSCKNS